MQPNMTPFAYGDHMVRSFLDEQGEPWFVAKDVCQILEVGYYRDAISRLDEDERGSVLVDTPGGKQEMSAISEPGMYALVFRSRKPQARAFSKWVRSEVLPALRKTGRYEQPSASASNQPWFMEEAELSLRPQMRARVLSSALRHASLVGATTDMEIENIYQRYCSRMAAVVPVEEENPAPAIDQPELIREFMRAHLVYARGMRVSATALHEVFADWWDEKMGILPPSLKALSRVVQERFVRGRKGGYCYYFNVSLRATD